MGLVLVEYYICGVLGVLSVKYNNTLKYRSECE